MNNNVFFQHPDLIRVLAVHETVMQLMVHTLSKASLDSPGNSTAMSSDIHLQSENSRDGARHRRSGTNLPSVIEESEEVAMHGKFPITNTIDSQ